MLSPTSSSHWMNQVLSNMGTFWVGHLHRNVLSLGRPCICKFLLLLFSGYQTAFGSWQSTFFGLNGTQYSPSLAVAPYHMKIGKLQSPLATVESFSMLFSHKITLSLSGVEPAMVVWEESTSTVSKDQHVKQIPSSGTTDLFPIRRIHCRTIVCIVL